MSTVELSLITTVVILVVAVAILGGAAHAQCRWAQEDQKYINWLQSEVKRMDAEYKDTWGSRDAARRPGDVACEDRA